MIKSHKTVEISGFLTLFALWQKDTDPYKVMTDPDPRGPKPSVPGRIQIRIRNIAWLNEFFCINTRVRYRYSCMFCHYTFS